ncbi:hypothetical protein CHS0354_009502 [Potamilus streckersoni]|uniref:WAP domain-containing protein n=1 Tax=Potamilus streckersoni TaxID=2493646 RepID=A0AAE0VK36_9BIVA|nr:hypothetical protein CHS0354_009502 [Potamilus streckersoni]
MTMLQSAIKFCLFLLLLLPITASGAKFGRHARCPKVKPYHTKYLILRPCIHMCDSDEDCDEFQMCCLNWCRGTTCLGHNGFCPLPAGGSCERKCSKDLECGKHSKCCFNGCGYECTKASNTQCPDGSSPVQCLINPCVVTDCPAFPNATCLANYCGGCNADFFVNGQKVECSMET